MPGTFEMGMGAGFGASDPPAAAVGKRDAAVERGRKLERDVRPAEAAAGKEAPQRRRRLARHRADIDGDARLAQPGDTPTVGARIGVPERDHRVRHPRRDQQLGARRAARRFVCARLERDIGDCAARVLARLRQCHRLGVGTATRLRPPAADHAAVANDDATDIGVGRGAAAPALAERQRRRHPARIDQSPHFLRLSSSFLKLSCRALARRSISALRASSLGRSRACCALISASLRLAGQLSK